jgi:hypothetical protein
VADLLLFPGYSKKELGYKNCVSQFPLVLFKTKPFIKGLYNICAWIYITIIRQGGKRNNQTTTSKVQVKIV